MRFLCANYNRDGEVIQRDLETLEILAGNSEMRFSLEQWKNTIISRLSTEVCKELI